METIISAHVSEILWNLTPLGTASRGEDKETGVSQTPAQEGISLDTTRSCIFFLNTWKPIFVQWHYF